MSKLQSAAAVKPFLWSEVKADYEPSRVVILPIPYEQQPPTAKAAKTGQMLSWMLLELNVTMRS